MDALIREAGLPVWGRVRPSVLVLVAIEVAGTRELLSSDDPQGWAEFIQLTARRPGGAAGTAAHGYRRSCHAARIRCVGGIRR